MCMCVCACMLWRRQICCITLRAPHCYSFKYSWDRRWKMGSIKEQVKASPVGKLQEKSNEWMNESKYDRKKEKEQMSEKAKEQKDRGGRGNDWCLLVEKHPALFGVRPAAEMPRPTNWSTLARCAHKSQLKCNYMIIHSTIQFRGTIQIRSKMATRSQHICQHH